MSKVRSAGARIRHLTDLTTDLTCRVIFGPVET
jgi:hypothetical protein